MAYLLEWQLLAFDIIKALAMISICWKEVQPFSFVKEFKSPSPFVHSSYYIEYMIFQKRFSAKSSRPFKVFEGKIFLTR